ncbi:hypothetical protein Taro_053012 [Colocasia esculenta]|uniref:CASP-like protein n=1 Tax=Colocasia esculenta TaxID=4460 RepID=A0A843XJS8_COLES|nr:hypothetical protein [Colocasia esculenta]
MTTAEAAAAAAAEEAGAEGAPGSSGCRRCDFCEEERALVYCRGDSARLCLACDRLVHAANTVSSRHSRALLCDSCLSAPASILLGSSQRRDGRRPRLLCPNCDFDAALGDVDGDRAGERRPVEPYSGCPTAVEMVALFGVSVEKEKSLLLDGGGGFGWADGSGADEGSSWPLAEAGWVWETPPILSMEDIIVPTKPCHGFQAMGVPPPPKDRNAACGRHKDEILRQLRDLVKSEVCVGSDFGWLQAEMGYQSPQIELGNVFSNVENNTALVVSPYPPPKALDKDCSKTDGLPAPCSGNQFEMPMEESNTFLDGPVDAHDSVSDRGSLHLISKEDLPALSPKCGLKLSGLERDTVLSRYKEKRKTRRQIRYETRKVRADCRVRIKGRFAKLMAGVLASATGAGGAIAYIGLKGDDHAGWNQICNIYDTFCRHIAGAVAGSLFGSVVLVALVGLSAYSVYRCSR